MKIKENKNKIYLGAIVLLIAGFIFVNFNNNVFALTEDEKKEIEDKQDELEKLEEKAAAYEKIIQLKQKEQTLLSQKINSLNSEIVETKQSIESNIKTIDELNDQIKSLENQIAESEKLLKAQKELLSEVVRSYYERDSGVYSKIFMGLDTFSGFALKKDHLSQTGEKITEITSSLKALKDDLDIKKERLMKNKDELIRERDSLEAENARLGIAKVEKSTILIQTQGDERKYQEKLSKIEKQKQELLGDIDALYNENFAEISEFAKGLDKPTSGLASTSWYYSQKDSRWGNKTIGNSNSKMKDYGCAISSVAMVFTYHGEKINPGELCKEPIYYWDLISWPKSWDGLRLSSSIAHSGVSWNTIDKEIGDGNPVIIFINARNGAGHYVVIHSKDKKGKYVVHDPYWGSNIYLESSIMLLSKLYKVSISYKSIDQMIIYK
ncbi:MAG: C39 family peptidase [Candidatus Moranbacteria bacterium]|jgi:peptidoglycan hydrolase CwlO-like protein|nr:C39 family peptidase [Candidatus Moranbacteria bacterium]MDX9855228.1 C39 family peptidase [Candidatus Moranbacteria bacterium]